MKGHAHKLEKSLIRERRVTHTRAQSRPHKSEKSCTRVPEKVVLKYVKDHVHKLKKSHAQERRLTLITAKKHTQQRKVARIREKETAALVSLTHVLVRCKRHDCMKSCLISIKLN